MFLKEHTEYMWVIYPLSHDVVFGSDITPCIKMDKVLVVCILKRQSQQKSSAFLIY